MPQADFRFEFEWESAESVRAPELRTTWARLEIWIGSECISYVEDRESRSGRRSIYGSLYPLAEWIAYNWWLLQAHTRPAGLAPSAFRHANRFRSTGPQFAWLDHHNLRSIGEGQSWPDMSLLPQGDTVRVVWFADESTPDHAPVRFVSGGDAVVATPGFLSACAQLIDAVITRLAEAGVHGTRLSSEWAAVRQTATHEDAFCVAAARLGLDPYAVSDEVSELIIEAGKQLEPGLHEDFYSAVNRADLQAGLAWVLDAQRRLISASGPDESLVGELRAGVTVQDGSRLPLQPWHVGWSQARDVRRRLNLDATQPMPLDEYIGTIGKPPVDQGLQGLGGGSRTGSSVLVTDMEAPASRRRFLQARALWHLVHRPGQPRFLIVPGNTERHRIERAFAAEILAPAAGIDEHLGGPPGPVREDQLEEVARSFGVSPTLVRHQVENQIGLAVEATY